MISIKPISPKQTWPIRHTVLSPEKEFTASPLPDDNECFHYGLYEKDELVSVVTFFQEEDHVQFRKLGTVEQKQKKGYGTRLLNYLINYSKTSGIKKILCSAGNSAAAFYKKLGFTETEKTYIHNGQKYTVMELNLQ